MQTNLLTDHLNIYSIAASFWVVIG